MLQPPSPLFLLSGIGMMLVAVAAVLLWQRGKAPLWAFVGFGALAWVVAVALKAAWAVPTNEYVHSGLQHLLPQSLAEPVFWLYIGLLTGIFECGVTQLFAVKTRLKKSDWNQAVAFGIGFGGVEAFLLGAVSFIGLLAVIVFFERIPAETRTEVIKALGDSPASIPLPIVERVTALLVHIYSCALIVYGTLVKEWRWFWFSFAYKTAVDAFAAWGILSFGVKESVAKMAQFEGMLLIFPVLALIGLWALKRKFRDAQRRESEAYAD